MRPTGFFTLIALAAALSMRSLGAAEPSPGLGFKLATQLAYDDNIQATEKNTKSDLVLSILPMILSL